MQRRALVSKRRLSRRTLLSTVFAGGLVDPRVACCLFEPPPGKRPSTGRSDQSAAQARVREPRPVRDAQLRQAGPNGNSMLNNVGIKTTLITHDYDKDFVDAGKGSRQGYFDRDTAGFFAEAGYSESDEYLYSYFHSKSTSNGEHLSDPALDALIDKERTLVDQNERLKSVQKIQKYIADNMFVVPSVGSYAFELVAPRVQNFQFTSVSGRHD
jgi:ABC-type oligopeptide transport system substrate-binding subunit